MLRLTALWLALLLPLASHAAPVAIDLSGFGVGSNGSGINAFSLTGTLQGDLGADATLTDIHGAMSFQVLGSGIGGVLGVVGGTLDLEGDGDSGSTASFFELVVGGTLYFPDSSILGPANSFDGGKLYLVGSSWDPLLTERPAGQWFSVALAGTVRPGGLSGATSPVPEPASLAMLAAGGLLVGAAVRRRD